MKKRSIIIVGGVALLILIGVFIKIRSPKTPTFSSALVERTNLQQSVTETGSVSPDVNIQFGFETNGHVKSILKRVGDNVVTGDILATLDGASQLASLRQAQAGLAAAEAALNLRLAGATNDDIAKSAATVDQLKATVAQTQAQMQRTEANGEASIASAQSALDTAKNNLQLVSGTLDNNQIVNNAYASLLDSLNSTGSSLMNGLNTSDSILGIDSPLSNYDVAQYLSSADPGKLSNAKTSYRIARNNLTTARNAISGLNQSSSHASIDSALVLMQTAVSSVQTNLFDVQTMLLYSIPYAVLTQSRLDSMKSSISTAQDSVNVSSEALTASSQGIQTAKNNFTAYQIAYNKAVSDLDTVKRQVAADLASAESSLQIQQAALAAAQASYNGLIAKPRDVDVAGLRAEVVRNQALVAAAQAEYEKTNLTAFADGVLAALDLEIGKTITANSPIANIISPQIRIDVDIAESDIAKIALHDTVVISFDSFPGVKFNGSVISIDPAQTEISGVIYYKTKILLSESNGAAIRPGMTTNVQILTDHKDNIIVIPERAILEKNGKKIVRVLTNKKIAKYEEREVTTGLRGDEGKVEIQNGLNEGEEIITFIKEN